MSNFVLFDTSILVDQLRTGRHQEKIQSITELVRTSSVVLAELWRGSSSRHAEREVLRVIEKKLSCAPYRRDKTGSNPESC